MTTMKLRLELDSTKIKAYDSVTGAEVTDKFDIAEQRCDDCRRKMASLSRRNAVNTQVIDTTKFAFGRYYKFDIN